MRAVRQAGVGLRAGASAEPSAVELAFEAGYTAAAGIAASGWSTGCTFFDADGDGDLDLYIARYVATTWDSVAKAQRTLRWRGGPQIMVGPTGLPGEADLFYENVGRGRFVEATDRLSSEAVLVPGNRSINRSLNVFAISGKLPFPRR